jgi:hypothetical protein
MASQSFPAQIVSATLSSGDNTVVASSAGQPIKVWKVIVSPGANADSVTLKFTNGGSAETAIISVAANGDSAICPYDGIPYALSDPGTAFVANSGTTTTNITAYCTKGAKKSRLLLL